MRKIYLKKYKNKIIILYIYYLYTIIYLIYTSYKEIIVIIQKKKIVIS